MKCICLDGNQSFGMLLRWDPFWDEMLRFVLDFQVDPSGPLATLRKLLLSDESIASFKRWVTDHWYAVLLIVFAVLSVLVSTSNSRLFVIDKFLGHFWVVLAQSLWYVTVFDTVIHFSGKMGNQLWLLAGRPFYQRICYWLWVHTNIVFCKKLHVIQNISISSGFQVSKGTGTWFVSFKNFDIRCL